VIRLAYSFFYTCFFLVALPYFLIAGLLRRKYLISAGERFGFVPLSSDRPSIWVHAVSVGEFFAAKPLLQRIREEWPEIPLFVSTTTVTGQKLASKMFPSSSFFFPFDWTWCIRKIFRRIRPALVLILETEIWPNFLWESHNRRVPVILVNGRLSDRSFVRYRLLRRWLPRFSKCLMQSETDATRMFMLGMPGEHVHVTGNMKFDFQPHRIAEDLYRLVDQWKGASLLWIAGSTMDSEEEIVLDAFLRLRQSFDLKLLLAVRHPERFEEVAALLSSRSVPFTRRSQGKAKDESVLLLDTMGELAACYEFADLVFVGGTFSHTGGHNPIEPAYYGKAILSGPNFSNFRAVFEEFRQRNAMVITGDLYAAAGALLQDEKRRKEIGVAAAALVKENTGATERVLKHVRQYLHDRSLLEPHQKLLVR
jgi:3-deoxy-D-manno-octulosonic-acid transferase